MNVYFFSDSIITPGGNKTSFFSGTRVNSGPWPVARDSAVLCAFVPYAYVPSALHFSL
jgi:hypothetical protein